MMIDMKENIAAKLIRNYQLILESNIYELEISKTNIEETLKEIVSQIEEMEAELGRCNKVVWMDTGGLDNEH